MKHNPNCTTGGTLPIPLRPRAKSSLQGHRTPAARAKQGKKGSNNQCQHSKQRQPTHDKTTTRKTEVDANDSEARTKQKKPMELETNSCGGTRKNQHLKTCFQKCLHSGKRISVRKNHVNLLKNANFAIVSHPQTCCPKIFSLLKNANFAIVFHPQTCCPKNFMRFPWIQKLRWFSLSETLP